MTGTVNVVQSGNTIELTGGSALKPLILPGPFEPYGTPGNLAVRGADNVNPGLWNIALRDVVVDYVMTPQPIDANGNFVSAGTIYFKSGTADCINTVEQIPYSFPLALAFPNGLPTSYAQNAKILVLPGFWELVQPFKIAPSISIDATHTVTFVLGGRIVAYAVPEPQSFALAVVGGCIALLPILRRSSRSAIWRCRHRPRQQR